MDVEKTLFENGSVWHVSTSGWTGADRLTAEDLDKERSDIPDIFKLGSKYLAPKDIRIALNAARSKVPALMNRVGKSFIVRGTWFVPDKNAMIAKEGLEKIEEEQQAVVDSVIERMPSIRAQMMDEYPVLRLAEWPTNDEIRKKFGVKWLVFEISGTSAKKTDPESLIEARQEFQTELRQAYDELKDNILKEAHVAILEACEEIATRLLETGEKVTAATLNKPRKIIDEYDNVARLFDLDDIKAKVAEVKALVDQADAKELRDRWDVSKKFGETLRSLTADIGDLSGLSSDGRAKRRIDFDRKAA